MRSEYYVSNLLTEIASIKARLAALEKALPSARAGGSGATAMAMGTDLPPVVLPPADEIRPVYFLDSTTRIVYQGVVAFVNGKERFYLQRVGRVREEAE